MRTYVYVDGFNLYYGSLKGTPYKWLDLAALFSRCLLPIHNIAHIKYFTARVTARPADPGAPLRQDVYLRALRARTPSLEVIEGRYTQKTKRMPRSLPPHNTVEVIFTEEKGSDVNLAVHMVYDGCAGAFDCAVVVSNDSDLSEALRLVKSGLKKRVIHLCPGDPVLRPPNAQLRRWAHKSISIAQADLAASQLPNPIPGTTIHKPATW